MPRRRSEVRDQQRLLPIAVREVSADSDGGATPRRPAMRTPLRLIVLALTSVLAALALTTPASAAASPYCGITWGSLGRSAGPLSASSATLTDVRAGRHDCYDRLVLDLGNAPGPVGYRVSYTTVRGVASGAPIPLAGDGDLQITVYAHGGSLDDPDHLVDVT